MAEKKISYNKASLGDSAQNNAVFQGNTIGNLVINANSTSVLEIYNDVGRYDLIQSEIKRVVTAAEKMHPLFPDYRAKYDSGLGKLISSPETEKALELYPKSIKGSFRIDYSKYPYMNKNETPWDYAYRTQTQVELDTTSYKEYLGDMEDPFPRRTYADGMITIIKAEEFPQAVEAIIKSGDVSIPVLLRRKPCMEYGKLLIGTVSDGCGMDICIIEETENQDVSLTIKMLPRCSLQTQLNRSKLLIQILETKRASIYIEDVLVLEVEYDDQQLSSGIFENAKRMVQYVENLTKIEQHTLCKFDLSVTSFSNDDYILSFILVASIENKWMKIKMEFDDEVRCDYNDIANEVLNDISPTEQFVYEEGGVDIAFQGHSFYAKTYTTVYSNAHINNLKSVKKNVKKKKKSIMITMRPLEGEKEFYKLCKVEGLKLVS